jgi:hypothetical protein
MTPKELANYDRALWNELEEQYVLNLDRFPLQPQHFARAYKSLSIRHNLIFTRHFDKFETLYKNSLKIN